MLVSFLLYYPVFKLSKKIRLVVYGLSNSVFVSNKLRGERG